MEKLPTEFIRALEYYAGTVEEANEVGWILYDLTGKTTLRGVSEEVISEAVQLVKSM